MACLGIVSINYLRSGLRPGSFRRLSLEVCIELQRCLYKDACNLVNSESQQDIVPEGYKLLIEFEFTQFSVKKILIHSIGSISSSK